MSAKSNHLKRKRPKKYYCSTSGKKKKLEELEPGSKGFLITCNEKREPVVVSEAYKLLNEYADTIYGPENLEKESQSHDDSDVPNNDEDQSIEDALKKEVESLKCCNFTERRFKAVKTKVKNVLFIKTTLEDPNRIVDAIFHDIEQTRLKKTRYCMKLMPIMKTCYASEKSIKQQTEQIFRQFFQEGRDEATYCIVFKSRCNSNVKRDVIVPEVAKIIEDLNDDWRVNYSAPDYVVTLDVITNVCAIGILKDFYRFRKYNLQLMAEEKNMEESRKVNIEGKVDKETELHDEKGDLTLQDNNRQSKIGGNEVIRTQIDSQSQELKELDDKCDSQGR